MRSIRFYVISGLVLLPLLSLLSLIYPLIFGSQERPIGPAYARSAEVAAGDPANGGALYLSKCYGCHAPEAKAAAVLNTEDFKTRYADDESIIAVVRAGSLPMPAFNEQMLNDQEMADIIAYIRSLP
jgi:mono/diheme cytochrome c family protein